MLISKYKERFLSALKGEASARDTSVNWERVGSRHIAQPYQIVLTLNGFMTYKRQQNKLKPVSGPHDGLDEAKRAVQRHAERAY